MIAVKFTDGKSEPSSGRMRRVNLMPAALAAVHRVRPVPLVLLFLGLSRFLAPEAAALICARHYWMVNNRIDFERYEILGFWRPSQSYPAYLDSQS